jgi:pimeloyl-ACP methyl ester carboxylesterase
MHNIPLPSNTRLFSEAFSWTEFPRLFLHAPDLLTQRRGNGERVLVFPGFGAGDFSTLVLRNYLGYLGYNAAGWQQGVNMGDVMSMITQLTQAVRSEAERSQKPLILIGWSLGGYLAREVARELPGMVSQVLTMGSPIIGGPKYTRVASLFQGTGMSLDMIEQAIELRDQTPLHLPITNIYSKNDGVVAWEACIDHKSSAVEHFEVNTTHLGLGISADVFRIVARQLDKNLMGLNASMEQNSPAL